MTATACSGVFLCYYMYMAQKNIIVCYDLTRLLLLLQLHGVNWVFVGFGVFRRFRFIVVDFDLYFKIGRVCLCAPRFSASINPLYPATDCAAATDISGVSGRWQLSR